MPVLSINVPVDPVRPRGSPGGEAPQRHGLESTEGQRSSLAHLSRYQVATEADLIFRIDAEQLGYLNRPRGLARYYRDYGMLPPRYIAVKFYTNQALPAVPRNRQFVASLVGRLTERADVVLLQTGLALDDHAEYGSGGERVYSIERLMTPRNNLDLQTRVIARADALVTTYGGFSYLGPMLGVKTLALYSNPDGFRIDHLEVAQRTFHELHAPPFVAVRTDDVRTLEGLLGSEQAAVAR